MGYSRDTLGVLLGHFVDALMTLMGYSPDAWGPLWEHFWGTLVRYESCLTVLIECILGKLYGFSRDT